MWAKKKKPLQPATTEEFDPSHQKYVQDLVKEGRISASEQDRMLFLIKGSCHITLSPLFFW